MFAFIPCSLALQNGIFPNAPMRTSSVVTQFQNSDLSAQSSSESPSVLRYIEILTILLTESDSTTLTSSQSNRRASAGACSGLLIREDLARELNILVNGLIFCLKSISRVVRISSNRNENKLI